MTPRKILMIIPALTTGGAQRSLSKLSIELARDHKVWVVIFNRNDEVSYPYGGELLSLEVPGGKGLFRKLRSFVERIRRLRTIKETHEIDVSISFLEGADYINILSRSTDRIIVSIRGSKFHDETIRNSFFWVRQKILIPRLYRKADAIVTVNHGIANELRENYGLRNSKILTIGNFYNTEEVTRLANEVKGENLERLYKDRVLITTGRLAPEKGLTSLLRVFHGLKSRKKGIRLVIVGDGPCYKNLLHECAALGLRAHTGPDFETVPDVLFLGNQPNVFKYLHGATLYMLNSSSEGFPNGMAEAMICMVPVVSSDCPYGPREILAPEFPFPSTLPGENYALNGILMPVINSATDINVWIEALEAVLGKNDVLLELAKKGRNRVNHFDKELVLSQWHTLLNEDFRTIRT